MASSYSKSDRTEETTTAPSTLYGKWEKTGVSQRRTKATTQAVTN